MGLEAASSVRNPAPVAGLAVPFVLGLAAWGLDRLLGLNWPSLILVRRDTEKVRYSFQATTSWLLGPLLLWSLISAASFSFQWMYSVQVHPSIRSVLQHMVTPTTQWAQPPWGEYFWFVSAREADLKIATLFRPWHWKDREYPKPYIEGVRHEIDPESSGFVLNESGVNIVVKPENEYALVETANDWSPCQAHARGGDIDVICQANTKGILIVHENSWSGWSAQQDGRSIELLSGNWLRVEAPAGLHRYSFRYRPWDVPLGMALSLIGIVVSAILWWRWSTGSTQFNHGHRL